MTSTSFNVGMSSDRSSSKDDKNNTSSGSESDDEDYVPSGKELRDEQQASEEPTDDSEEEAKNGGGGGASTKRGRASRRRKKRAKLEELPEKELDEVEQQQPTKSAVAANIDDIWNEFKKDCRTMESKVAKTAAPAAASAKESADASKKTVAAADEVERQQLEPEARPSSDEPKTKTITEIFEFAGEAVEVQKEVPVDAPVPAAPVLKPRAQTSRGGGGLSSVLGQIGKKNRLSVLEKTKLDWDSFKQNEGIAEDLQMHNRGKEGYLEKQDFLQRADLRQFELEKAMRSSSRRFK